MRLTHLAYCRAACRQALGSIEMVIPLDDQLLRPILSSPVEAFCIAAAGALSSSAFVLPVLKQKGWEQRADGIAALAVLLLQVRLDAAGCRRRRPTDDGFRYAPIPPLWPPLASHIPRLEHLCSQCVPLRPIASHCVP